MKPSYRAHVDGMRAVAILLVVAFHAFPSGGVRAGYLGVDLFFVISGFVISRKLLDEVTRRGRISWGRFLLGRFRRLVPAYAVMVVVVLAAGTVLLAPLGDTQGLAKSSLASTLFLGNAYYWQLEPTNYFQPPARGPAIMLHTWSLGVEEQFYVAIAIVAVVAGLLRIRVRRHRSVHRLTLWVAGASLVTLGAAQWLAAAHAGPVFYSPVLRLWEFGAGALAMLCSQVGQRRPRVVLAVSAAALVVSLAVISVRGDKYSPFVALVPVVATALVLWSAEGADSPVTALLRTRPMVGIGRLSYSWYLWHWPLLGLAEAFYLGEIGLPWRIVVVLVALGFAAGSYRFVELRYWTPVHAEPSAPRRTSPHRTRQVAVLLVVALVAGGATGWVARQRADSPGWVQARERQLDQPYLPEQCARMNDDGITELYLVGCQLYTSSVDDNRLVVLWGDSHAWQYVPALERMARETDVSFIAWVGAGCPPTEDLDSPAGLVPDQVPRYEFCDVRNHHAYDYLRDQIATGRDVTIVYASRWPMYFGGDPLSLADRAAFDADRRLVDDLGVGMRRDLPRLVEDFGAAGARQVVVAPIPELRRESPLCLALRRPFRCDVDVATETPYLAQAREFVDGLRAHDPDLILVDPSESMCDDRTCRVLAGDQAMYFDDDHLSATYSATLAPLFADAFTPRVFAGSG